MQGLTIHQPWAWLIANGYKTIETRNWPTDYRGKLAIHAGRTLASEDAEAFRSVGVPVPKDEDLILGAVVAVADLVDCRPLADTVEDARRASALTLSADALRTFYARTEEWSGLAHADTFAWEFLRVLPVRPTPWRGARGLWPVPFELLEELRAAYLALQVQGGNT